MKAIRLYSHDLQNALGIVAGNVHLLRTEGGGTTEKGMVDDIVSATEVAVRASRALSVLVREMANVPEWFDPRQLLHEEVQKFSRESGCVLELGNTLPMNENLEILGNPQLLALAFEGMLYQVAGFSEMRHALVVRCGRKPIREQEVGASVSRACYLSCWFHISIERDTSLPSASRPPKGSAISPLRWAAAGRAVALDMLAVSGGRLWSAGRPKAGMRTVHLRMPARLQRTAPLEKGSTRVGVSVSGSHDVKRSQISDSLA